MSTYTLQVQNPTHCNLLRSDVFSFLHLHINFIMQVSTAFNKLLVLLGAVIVAGTCLTGRSFFVAAGQCERTKRIEIEVRPPRDGCSPGKIRLHTCDGDCNSHWTVNQNITPLEPPHVLTQCSCCGPTEWILSKRRVDFDCGGSEPERHTVHFNKVVTCGCVQCFN